MKEVLFTLKYVGLFLALSFSHTTLAQVPEHFSSSELCSQHKVGQFSQALKSAQGAADDYDLTYANIHWDLDPAVKYISGKIDFQFRAKLNALAFIEFDMHDSLSVDSIVYHGSPATFTRTKTNVLSITLPNSINQGVLDSVTIFYQGKPVSNGFGSFEQNQHNGTPIIWTLSEPYGAMEWWPTKQSLNDKIDSLDLVVTVPAGNKVAGNGLLVSEVTSGGNTTVHWKSRNPIAAYLVAIAITNYSAYSDFANLQNGQLEILNYVYPEDLAQAQGYTQSTIEILELFDSLTIPYPFSNEKYGHAQFGWGGGMEHQTMSFMGGFWYSLIAHEGAHQWFGDHVTCGSWHDIWLNEGLATYFEGLTVERYQTTGLWNYWKILKTQNIVSKPGGSVYVDDTTSVNRIFDGRLSYDKGAMVISMLRYVVGDSAFFQGLTNYLSDPNLAGGYAHTADLQQHLEASSGKNLNTFFNQWVYGEGYPIYNFSWGQNGNTVTIEVNQTQSHPSVSFYEMPLPVKLEGQGLDTILRLENTTNGQVFSLNIPFTVSNLVFDPGFDLVYGTTQIVNLEESNVSPFRIYPNPVHNFLMIESSENDPIEKISIISTTGQVLSDLPNFKNDKIDVSTLPKGSYQAKIEVSSGTYHHHFIKK